MATTEEREPLAVVSVLVETEGGDCAILDTSMLPVHEAEQLARYWQQGGHPVEMEVLPG